MCHCHPGFTASLYLGVPSAGSYSFLPLLFRWQSHTSAHKFAEAQQQCPCRGGYQREGRRGGVPRAQNRPGGRPLRGTGRSPCEWAWCHPGRGAGVSAARQSLRHTKWICWRWVSSMNCQNGCPCQASKPEGRIRASSV